MASEILIIRSVSLQQLDGVLAGIVAAFPGRRPVLLTHPHSLAAASKYPGLAEVVAYPHKGAFQVWRRPAALRGRRFDAVIVPVSSLGGGGFFNVFAFAFTVPAGRRLVCRPTGELTELRAAGLLRLAAVRLAAFLLAGVVVLAASPLIALLLPLMLARLGSGKE